ncbi:hypothetical protein DFQ27_004493, partial [Actinomortierella ambigua]
MGCSEVGARATGIPTVLNPNIGDSMKSMTPTCRAMFWCSLTLIKRYMGQLNKKKDKNCLLEAGVCLSGVFNNISTLMQDLLIEARTSKDNIGDVSATLDRIVATRFTWGNFPEHKCSKIMNDLTKNLKEEEFDFDQFLGDVTTLFNEAPKGSLEKKVYGTIFFLCDEIGYTKPNSEAECVNLWQGVIKRVIGKGAEFETRIGELALECSKFERQRQKQELAHLGIVCDAGRKTDLTFVVMLQEIIGRVAAMSSIECKKEDAS